jgi:hypothetical protein
LGLGKILQSIHVWKYRENIAKGILNKALNLALFEIDLKTRFY